MDAVNMKSECFQFELGGACRKWIALLKKRAARLSPAARTAQEQSTSRRMLCSDEQEAGGADEA
ncbi:hypothetical protein RA280_06955 [Cupriavidus sp. CV2]|uniref:hypothetical protein n=1 Tax=Cupriavidus ulmosensis TaxID=3065913 RepID=UPI00296AD2BD|nr:hypothetical protein [Cupriavidus sp. CV2]MDW3681489.1 hypothetical protein [Cupriavidus sp. CV2]